MRKNIILHYMNVLLLITAAHSCSYAQYINKLRDFDHTFDWGWRIFLKPDDSFFVMGAARDTITNRWFMTSMSISTNGNIATGKKRIQYSNAQVYIGDPGQAQVTGNGEYISPITCQISSGSPLRSIAGLVKLKPTGDTIFLKTYTDTNLFFDLMYTCAVMPDGGYVGGGGRGRNTPTKYPGLVVRTDSMGDTLWTKTYQKSSSQTVNIYTIIPLDNARILLGAGSSYQIPVGSTSTYNHNAPWFIVLDSMGNILKDTAYTSGFVGGGRIYKDMNGGYIHFGSFDSLFTNDATDHENFPGYVAHLDTNFRITWLKEFNFSVAAGHREPWGFRQLKDSSYMVYGDRWPAYLALEPASMGWASRLDRNGNIMWSNTYISDTNYNQNSYIRDMVEMPGGDLVFIGAGFNDSMPSWHQHQNVWLLGVDGNGCEIAGCTPLKATQAPAERAEVLRIWPNPSYGDITVQAQEPGMLHVYNVQGQEVAAYTITAGDTHLRLPATLSTGLYLCKYFSAAGNKEPQVVRLMYQR